ncbi:MAG: hypothetical protein ACI3VY_01855 [Faecousia sp.]
MKNYIIPILVLTIIILAMANVVQFIMFRFRMREMLRVAKKAVRDAEGAREYGKTMKLIHVAERECIKDLEFKLATEKTLNESLFQQNAKLKQKLKIAQTWNDKKKSETVEQKEGDK